MSQSKYPNTHVSKTRMPLRYFAVHFVFIYVFFLFVPLFLFVYVFVKLTRFMEGGDIIESTTTYILAGGFLFRDAG